MPDQNLLALARANQVREERKAIKDKLARRELLLDDVLEQPIPRCLANMRVVDLIASARGFGQPKAKRVIKRFRHPESRRLGSLSKPQRVELVLLLARHNGQALYGAAHREYIC